jgi:orotidine-5'-phosphate decarboxylase
MAQLASAVPIVALDVPDAVAALALVDELGELCRFYKVGSELFTAAGPAVVEALRARDVDVFLDLKLHDIPNTVRGAARSAARLGARLLTVHASGGVDMVVAAVDGAGPTCGVLAVTVLTSHDAASLARAWGRKSLDVRAEVLRLADQARFANAHGIVCSGDEVADVHGRHGSALRLLVPGIRLAGGESHDQARVVTPARAAMAGASYLVLGRAVTAAADRPAAMERVLTELRGAAA